MNSIMIARYKPYEHIPLSREIVLRSLQPVGRMFKAEHSTKHIALGRQEKVTKHIRPILIFGELEWLVSNIPQQDRP